MIILGLDFETTGLNFESDRIIEVGAVLWDTATASPVQIYNTLVVHPDAPPITAEIEGLTGINQAMIDGYGQPASEVFFALTELILKAQFIVAHNGLGFDKPMLDAQYLRRPCVPSSVALPTWIDTCLDVPYPPRITTRKLVHLAAEHGFVNPFAHRAVFDVLTMLRVLAAYSIDEVVLSSQQPLVNLVAVVSFDDKDKAKARGYRWNGETRQWVRSLKAHLVPREIEECGFRVDVLTTV